MLSQKNSEKDFAALDAVPVSAASENGAAVQALMEVLQASPEFQIAEDFSEYLTSPMEDSPWGDFLQTPALGSTDIASDFLTSPAIVDADNFDDFGNTPSLFGGSLGLTGGAAHDHYKASAKLSSAHAVPAASIDYDQMYTMPSPHTPALDPASLHSSPRAASTNPPSSRRRNAPTGTRKNATPDTLIPVDAPIQSRKYVTPSATSRKDVPAVFAKKRARSQAFGDEDEVDLADLPQSDLDAIEAKRRQNTLAARRSRKRKLEYQRELEVALEQERADKEMWVARAAMYEALLRQHGLQVPPLCNT
ncbi:hypothetical protein POSPLADRAFT_1050639 [Postia placenta MAD-698-R-SB12]|uniref:BZIP domain-containing protein n=1 Tax=Postia placenta MAD-698-R-SB12 TaxID=670580 RepID=A0A1X6MK47_9APHY|nr:hypothetical protein POSPLADRAFT_1050639 [Postia placenta MAD-698-R-SB12]OSX56413.1 hypothetical protein POSPLADRAFT_1050639 [Postia placenta MAD-698-R-SB12]